MIDRKEVNDDNNNSKLMIQVYKWYYYALKNICFFIGFHWIVVVALPYPHLLLSFLEYQVKM